MPRRLNIPSRYRAALSSIRSLSEESVQRIRSLLDEVMLPVAHRAENETTVPSDPIAIITAVKRSAARTDVAHVKEIVDALAVLYEIKSQVDVSVEEFVDDVCDAMEALDSDQRLPHGERADFAGKLLTLLNAEVFAIVAKAYDLATEDERTFCHARILTDLRPVFGRNLDDGPKAMVLMHTLKLAYHEQGSKKDHEEFYIALDAEDLDRLRKLIDRAEEKAKKLTRAMGNMHLFGTSTKE